MEASRLVRDEPCPTCEALGEFHGRGERRSPFHESMDRTDVSGGGLDQKREAMGCNASVESQEETCCSSHGPALGGADVYSNVYRIRC